MKEAHLFEQGKSKYKRRRNSFVKNLWGKIGFLETRLRTLTKIAVFLFLVSLIILLPPFWINEIEVRGLIKLNKENIIQKSGLQIGQHMLQGLGTNIRNYFLLQFSSAEERLIEAYTEIESVNISPVFPSKVIIDIKERIPIAYLAAENAFVQIDKHGVVMKISKEKPSLAPVIDGLKTGSFKLGKPISKELSKEIAGVVMILAEMIKSEAKMGKTNAFVPHIERIKLQNNNIYLFQFKRSKRSEGSEGSEEEPLYVKFKLDNNVKARVNWFINAMSQGTFAKLPAGLLDLSGKRQLFMPTKNILPYKRRDLEIDEINALSNPVIQEEEKIKEEKIKEEKTKKEKNNKEKKRKK